MLRWKNYCTAGLLCSPKRYTNEMSLETLIQFAVKTWRLT